MRAVRYCPTCSAAFQSMARCPRDGATLSADGDPLLGQVLGDRYRILERISAGGMGQVYRAAHTRIASLVAVKVLFGEYAGESDIRTRFEREAEASSVLQSRYITRVLDFGETPSGLLYLVMELLDGVSLATAISQARFFSEERAARIVRKIAIGLAHAHERGIVHRDLKPHNVMLVAEDDEVDVPKILDFGIARMRERPGVTMPGMVMGTPIYMAPEQFLANGEVDARSDLYALGVMLYEAVAGVPPFDAPTPTAVFKLHAKAEMPPFSVTRPGFTPSRRFEAVVRRLLAKKQDDRFESARALAEALEFRFEARAEVTQKTANPLPMEPPLDVARDRLQRAIQRGAPLYNGGYTAGCATLYRTAAEELMIGALADPEHAAFRVRLASAVARAGTRAPQQAAWELRYAFDDLLALFADLRRTPTLGVSRATSPRFAGPELSSARRELTLASQIAERQYGAGHVEVVCDYLMLLAEDLAGRLPAKSALRARIEEGLTAARQSSGRAEAASAIGGAFDDVRFDGDTAAVLEDTVVRPSLGVRDVLSAAIAEGAPRYNDGDIEGCARLYLDAATRAVAALQGPDNVVARRLLSEAIDRARASGSNDAAWTLRHAFDAVLGAS